MTNLSPTGEWITHSSLLSNSNSLCHTKEGAKTRMIKRLKFVYDFYQWNCHQPDHLFKWSSITKSTKMELHIEIIVCTETLYRDAPVELYQCKSLYTIIRVYSLESLDIEKWILFKVPRKRSMDQFGWFHHGLKNLIEGTDDRTVTILFISTLRRFFKDNNGRWIPSQRL